MTLKGTSTHFSPFYEEKKDGYIFISIHYAWPKKQPQWNTSQTSTPTNGKAMAAYLKTAPTNKS